LIPGAVKRKKKKPKKKKAGGTGPAKQTEPPRIGVSKLFLSGQYPIGEIRDYTDQYSLEQNELTAAIYGE